MPSVPGLVGGSAFGVYPVNRFRLIGACIHDPSCRVPHDFASVKSSTDEKRQNDTGGTVVSTVLTSTR